MVTPSPATPPRCIIAESDKGWLLTVQNEQCSVMQVFSSAAAAHRAVDRMLEFFHVMSSQSPRPRAGVKLPATSCQLRAT